MIELGLSAENIPLLHRIRGKILEHKIKEGVHNDAFIAVPNYEERRCMVLWSGSSVKCHSCARQNRRAYIEDIGDEGDNTVYRYHK